MTNQVNWNGLPQDRGEEFIIDILCRETETFALPLRTTDTGLTERAHQLVQQVEVQNRCQLA